MKNIIKILATIVTLSLLNGCDDITAPTSQFKVGDTVYISDMNVTGKVTATWPLNQKLTVLTATTNGMIQEIQLPVELFKKVTPKIELEKN